ncbi:MAG: glycogen debranching protein GlgX, partial [Pseudomonadota bacterium]|nr:glycogen debranching protein GlgX [Pseudomonadota bacterium]
MSEVIARLERSAAHALGSNWDGRGTHFSVVAPDADKVELCLFDNTHRHDAARYEMDDCTDGVWRGYLPGCRPGQLYGYRVYGAYQPRQGYRFNPYKLLIDPYARQIAGELRWHDAIYGYRIGSARSDLSFDRRDSAVYMPKSVVTADGFDWGDDRPPRIPWTDTVIYEMHLRGFTRLRQDIPEHDRGTFGALGRADTVDYLRRLGVTAVELMPIHAFTRDRHLVERGLTNYWGYNSLSWFAPEPQYLSDGTLGQIKWAVQRLHAANIEVILDVVYNHTAEGSELGPTLCWRGYDNAGYYRLRADEPRHGTDDTGCGNTVNFSNPRTIQMVMDSLRYWVSEFHVDGFRFDLGVTLGREANGFDPGSGFFDALMQDPVLSQVKLISEPWDVGPGGYQLGNHPPGMAEWNGRYRDDVRRYWRGDPAARSAVAARLLGSADLFDHHRRRPWASINFVTAHDGFTLADLVSYGEKQNQANGEDNNDGSNDNFSHHWGEEGSSDDPAVIGRRDRLMRSLLTTLLVSHGTPMILAGDEFAHSQNGNNNAYCQDNET